MGIVKIGRACSCGTRVLLGILQKVNRIFASKIVFSVGMDRATERSSDRAIERRSDRACEKVIQGSSEQLSNRAVKELSEPASERKLNALFSKSIHKPAKSNKSKTFQKNHPQRRSAGRNTMKRYNFPQCPKCVSTAVVPKYLLGCL